MTHVSAIICTRNRPDLIGNAVASVLGNDYPSFDLLVLDQSDDDATEKAVRAIGEKRPGVRYLHSSLPGLSRAYNTAVRETTGALLAFTDDDCVAPRDWISSIVDAFRAYPRIDMLYGEVLIPTALRGHPGIIPQLRIPRARCMNRRTGFEIYGMGANFAARRSLFERVGGFDEILGGGAPLRSSQDFDFQYRVYLAGATLLLTPDVKVDHYGWRSAEQWTSTMHAYAFGNGAFYAKHVRCGDLYMLGMMAHHVGKQLVREALSRSGLRPRPSGMDYMRSYWEGVREGLRFPVDCRRRLYRLPPAGR